MKLKLFGDVIDDELAQVYDWLEIDSIHPGLVENAIENNTDGVLDVDISSYGGDVTAASNIYSQLKSYDGQVNIRVTGIAASSGSIIAMAADHLEMAPTAMMMIHNASTSVSGNNSDMQKAADMLSKTNDSIANAYVARSGKDKQEILDLMDKETWLTVDDAIELGLVDEIMHSKDAVVLNSALKMPTLDKIKELMASKNEGKKEKPAEQENNIAAKLKILRG